MKFALFLGNRGFFPERLIVREETAVAEEKSVPRFLP